MPARDVDPAPDATINAAPGGPAPLAQAGRGRRELPLLDLTALVANPSQITRPSTVLSQMYDTLFAAHVEPILRSLSAGDSADRIPGHLASSGTSSVFCLTMNSLPVIVKVVSPDRVYDELDPSLRSEGVARTPVILGYSAAAGVLVMSKIPGTNMTELTSAPVHTPDEMRQIFCTAIELVRRGMSIDENPKNLLYQPDSGFGLIDYFSGSTSSAGATLTALCKMIAEYPEALRPDAADRDGMIEFYYRSAIRHNETWTTALQVIREDYASIMPDILASGFAEVRSAASLAEYYPAAGDATPVARGRREALIRSLAKSENNLGVLLCELGAA
jgi:predicted Ser/Thr protein kinase